MIVVDASAVGTFLIPDEAGPFADLARSLCASEEIHVPAHWPVEMASLIRKAHRRGRIVDEQATTAARIVDEIAMVTVVGVTPPVERIVARSVALNLTPYDAAYLILAESLRAPLLSDDAALRRVAAEQGVRVLMP